MGIRLKFNNVLIAVFLAGFALAAWTSHELLQRNAKDEILRNSRLMMETAVAIRGYTRGMQQEQEPAAATSEPAQSGGSGLGLDPGGLLRGFMRR
jgi:hypothetical protein